MSSSEVVDFSAALRVYSREGEQDPHATWRDLEAYVRGTLPETRREDLVAHLSVCEECRLLLLEARAEHLDPVALDDRQLGEAWRELSVHLVQALAQRLRLAGDGKFPSPEDQINQLYDKIAALAQEEAQGLDREDEIEQAYEKLRRLQGAEARRSRREFEELLEAPLDAGQRIFAQVQALKEELEDLEATDPPFEEANSPQAFPQAS